MEGNQSRKTKKVGFEISKIVPSMGTLLHTLQRGGFSILVSKARKRFLENNVLFQHLKSFLGESANK